MMMIVAVSEYSSDGKQQDFFDADSDSENDTTESGEAIDNIMDEIGEAYGSIVEIRGRFRALLPEMKDVDTEKKKKILRRLLH